MECNKCKDQMIKGKVIASSPNLFGTMMSFRKEENLKKIMDKDQVNLETVGEAWYCPSCHYCLAELEEK
ncbi:PF20097 family protein [Neofamilia massiliensis]|uniref:PF20097 family protein n=1 Tax=Neofamilia massiliensis TaxID=1673724 RepID=UPI0006BB978D|nr:PF20097 family protein [Neofamilia massiliensis]